ncbi:MAG: hypothetical protein KAG66_14200, partial [Methylococcales bacterium]|nr:hypothetical protein [Methylococcales bacterium]
MLSNNGQVDKQIFAQSRLQNSGLLLLRYLVRFCSIVTIVVLQKCYKSPPIVIFYEFSDIVTMCLLGEIKLAIFDYR